MKIFISFILLVAHQCLFSQIYDTIPGKMDTLPVLTDTVRYNDTTIVNTPAGKDTVVKRKTHSPKQATLRSAIFPGLGQIYNRKYWKVPIVYAAIGVPAYLFFNNRKWYNKSKYALSIVVNNRTRADSLANADPIFKAAIDRKDISAIVNYRNQVRRDMDMSILVTLIMWGLNVVDATVDAHLRDFDVSDDVTLRVEPTLIQGTRTPGVSFVFNFK